MEKGKVTIERNAIENFLMAVKDFVKHHRKPVLSVFLAIVVGTFLFIAGAVYYDISTTKDLRAYETLLADYYTGAKDAVATDEFVSKLIKIVDSSKFGYVHNQGDFIIAGLYFEKKDYAQAMKYYQKYADKSSSDLVPIAMFQAGVCAEELGKFDQAFEIYKGIEKEHKDSIFADRMLYDIGRAYAKKGDLVKAREYFNKLMTQFPSSPFSSSAKVRILLLGAAK